MIPRNRRNSMNKIKIIFLGIMSGIFLSFISLGIAFIAASLFTGVIGFPAILIVSTIVNGAILGVVGISLRYISSGLEHRGLMLLISLAAASLAILLGNYRNGSLLPIAIYFLALSNGLIISRFTETIIGFKKTDHDLNLQS